MSSPTHYTRSCPVETADRRDCPERSPWCLARDQREQREAHICRLETLHVLPNSVRLRLHEDSDRTCGFVVVDVDALELEIRIAVVGTRGVDTMLVRNHLPELGERKEMDQVVGSGTLVSYTLAPTWLPRWPA